MLASSIRCLMHILMSFAWPDSCSWAQKTITQNIDAQNYSPENKESNEDIANQPQEDQAAGISQKSIQSNVDPRLVKYVEDSRARSLDDKDIERELIKVGWSEAEIQKALM